MKIYRRSQRGALAVIAVAACVALPAAAMADTVVSYTLSDAVFDAFAGGGTETLSGSWTVDYSPTAVTVTALSLTATGAETLTYNLSGLSYIQFSGSSSVAQYEINVASTQFAPLFLDYQASAPVGVVTDSITSGYASYLYNTSFDSSALTSAGTLSGTPITIGDVGGGVPEPATWCMMICGIFGVGAVLRRSKLRLQAV
jgi:hypothetical protein